MSHTKAHKPVRSKGRHKTGRASQAEGAEDSNCIELKGSVFTLTVLCLRSFDVDSIGRELDKRIKLAPGFFKNAPVVLDLKELNNINQTFNFQQLVEGLRDQYRLIPVGVRHGSVAQNTAAVQAGLAILQGGEANPGAANPDTPKPPPKTGGLLPKNEQIQAAEHSLLLDQPIRSGQQIYAQGDLVVLAPVNAGAEILADGNIHVYAPLRGRALAGIKGNEQARIFCHAMEAELISIAGQYRVFEEAVPKQYKGKPVQVYLQDERLVISPFNKMIVTK